jgi:hypothetical protein
MTRIALISDIHANDIALRAVLGDIRRTGVDQVVCLGDVVDLGPEPNAVIEILAELGCPCILGNHDESMLNPELVRGYNPSPVLVAAADWTRDRPMPRPRAYRAALQTRHDAHSIAHQWNYPVDVP